MAKSKPIHPTERAATAARRRVLRESVFRERMVWGLMLLIILLLIAGMMLLSGRSGAPHSATESSGEQSTQRSVTPTIQDSKPIVDEDTPNNTTPKPRVSDDIQRLKEESIPSISKVEKKAAAPEQITIEVVKPPVEPQKTPDLPSVEKPESKQPPSQPESKPKLELEDVAFLANPLPIIIPGSPAPARAITLLEFPSSPEDLKLTVYGLDELNAKLLKAGSKSKIQLHCFISEKDQSLVVGDKASGDPLATFYQHRRELRFRWKPRTSFSAVQQQFRDYCVLHLTWKGHPGRYYALHDVYARSARRVRDQHLRLRRNELPSGIDRENLYLGKGKLEIAEVYSHRFLTFPLSQRAEVPTLKRSRKDPPLFVKIDWQGNALALKLDAAVNNEEDTRRRRKLFEHVDGDFYLHASLYRVVEEKYKVEVLRIGSP